MVKSVDNPAKYTMEDVINTCKCKGIDRNENETQREWMKRFMCQYHWMQTDYYRRKIHKFLDGICEKCGQEEAIAGQECK